MNKFNRASLTFLSCLWLMGIIACQPQAQVLPLPITAPTVQPSPLPTPQQTDEPLPTASVSPTPLPTPLLPVLSTVFASKSFGSACRAPDGSVYSVSDNWIVKETLDGQLVYLHQPRFPDQSPLVNRGYQDGPLEQALFFDPQGCAFDQAGNLYLADQGVGIRKLTPDGIVSTFSGQPYLSRPGRLPDKQEIKDGRANAAVYSSFEDFKADLPRNRLLTSDQYGYLREISLTDGSVKTIYDLSDPEREDSGSMGFFFTIEPQSGKIYAINKIQKNIYLLEGGQSKQIHQNGYFTPTLYSPTKVLYHPQHKLIYITARQGSFIGKEPSFAVFNPQTKILRYLVLPKDSFDPQEPERESGLTLLNIDEQGNLFFFGRHLNQGALMKMSFPQNPPVLRVDEFE